MSWEDYRKEARADKAAAAAQRRADQTTAAQIRIAEQAAGEQVAAGRRAEQRAIAAQNKAKRKAARKAFVAALPELVVSLLGYGLIALPITLAWTAQAAFAADTLHLQGWTAQLFPASVETGAWWCLLLAELRTRKNLPVGSLIVWAWVLAGVASMINGAHGLHDNGWTAGLALAVLSVLGVVLHSISRRLRAADQTGGLSALRSRVWRRIRYPRLSLAAASIRAARQVDPAAAWLLAWLDRYGVGPDSTRAERRIAKVITGKQSKEDRAAAERGEITLVGGRVQHGWPSEVREYIDAERQAARAETEQITEQARQVVAEAHEALLSAGLVFGPDALSIPAQDRDEQASEQGEHHDQADEKLSPRATELLPALTEAIKDGDVAANPSVRAIIRWCQGTEHGSLGTPAAIELRNAVRQLALVDDQDDVDDAAETTELVDAVVAS